MSKTVYTFNVIPIKILMAYLTDLEQIFQKFIWNQKWHWIPSAILRKQNNVGRITIPGIILCYRAAVIKTVWYWHKNRHVDQWKNRCPEINPGLYGQLIFDKGGRSMKWSKNNLFNKWCWNNWTGTWKKMKLDHQLTPYTRINSKWIKDLNISCDTINLLAKTRQ